MSGTVKPIHCAPADQPRSVRELTQRLFPAYTVDGGALHLAGCRLEDRLFLQTTGSGQARAAALTMDDSGRSVDDGFARSLGMDETVAWQRPPEMPPDRLEEIVRRSTECARQRWGVAGELDALCIWCKHAEGKLRFTIGDQSVDLPFAGWTRTLEAPPFVCPHSGVASFHIAATDDGRIVAAESIRACEETGRRVPADELVICDATGQAVLADQTRTCPVTERPVLERALVTCSMCCQPVSPTVIQAGRCLACRSTRPIAKDEAPLASFLAAHENLHRWSSWAVSETAEVYVLVAAGWWKRLLVVIGKADMEVRHAALGRRFRGEFSPVGIHEIDGPNEAT